MNYNLHQKLNRSFFLTINLLRYIEKSKFSILNSERLFL